jgi:hypothetical protein
VAFADTASRRRADSRQKSPDLLLNQKIFLPEGLLITQKVRTNPWTENFDMTTEDDAATDNPPDNYFKEWRLHRGMTQAQVQQQLSWSDGRLSKMESGAVSAKPVALAALARLARKSTRCSPRCPTRAGTPPFRPRGRSYAAREAPR